MVNKINASDLQQGHIRRCGIMSVAAPTLVKQRPSSSLAAKVVYHFLDFWIY